MSMCATFVFWELWVRYCVVYLVLHVLHGAQQQRAASYNIGAKVHTSPSIFFFHGDPPILWPPKGQLSFEEPTHHQVMQVKQS
eukprot:5075055-Amphidinium_carterae.1